MFGSLSWRALLQSNPQGVEFLRQINSVIEQARIYFDKRIETFQGLAAGDPRLNSIRSRIVEGCLGIQDVKLEEICQDLFKEIETTLPDYSTLVGLLTRYFDVGKKKKVGFFQIDEEDFFKSFNDIIEQDEIGLAKLNVKLPEEYHKPAFVFLLLTLVTYMTYQANQSYGQSSLINHMLLHEQSEILYLAFLITKRQTGKEGALLCAVERYDFKISAFLIQGMVHFAVFERFTPHGRSIEAQDGTMSHAIVVKTIIAFTRMLNLDRDIDQIFKGYSEPYRESLKSLTYFCAFSDSVISLEVGVRPKITPRDLAIYENSDSKYANLVVIFNKILHIYYENEDKEALKVVELIDEDLIPQIKTFLLENVPSVTDTVNNLRNLNIDDMSNSETYFEYLSTCLIHLTLLTLIHSFYDVGTKRLQKNHRFSPLHKRFNLLSLKYALILCYLIPSIIECLQQAAVHPSSIEFGILPGLLSIFPHIRLIFRRAIVALCLRVFEFFPVDKRILFASIYKKYDKTDDEILQEILARQEFQPFFTMEDLENFDIDTDPEAVLEKFSILNNYTYLTLSIGKSVVDFQACLKNQYINMSFVRFNPPFFRILKCCSIFLNVAYSDTQDSSSVELEKTESNNSQSETLEYEHFIPPELTSYDFADFFNTSGIYDTTDIPEFLPFVHPDNNPEYPNI